MPTTVQEVLATLKQAACQENGQLAFAWQACPEALKQEHVELYQVYGKHAIGLEQPMHAFDMLSEGLARWPQDERLRYLSALALCRAGSTGAAQERVVALQQDLAPGAAIEIELLSLAGRIAKDQWDRLQPGDLRDAQGWRAVECYSEAFEASGEAFPGINAATMCLLMGDAQRAQRMAQKILEDQAGGDLDSYWTTATLGEACLLLRRFDEAVLWYQRAVSQMGGALGDLSSMRLQVQRLDGVLKLPSQVHEVLAGGQVLACVGHMIDASDREHARFPASLEDAVRTTIAARLEQLDARYGYVSLAGGTDILFAECMLERGAELHVALPFCREDFLKSSVQPGGSDWVQRFDQVLERATSLTYTTEEGYLGHAALFQYTSDYLCGAAQLRAERLGVPVCLLAVLDPLSPGGQGGTQMSLKAWGDARPSQVIDLSALRGEAARPGARALPVPPPPPALGSNERQVRSMLFTDVKGFSQLSEAQSPAFFSHVLGRMAAVLADSDAQPIFRNTWGDGLFLVFEEVQAAARFALNLRDAMRLTDWTQWGLPKELTIRIALHTGPVFPCMDPIIEQQNFFGAHVNRAARIEPVTAPGQIYVSEAVAALLRMSGGLSYDFDYQGRVALAKDYGVTPLYRLRRRGELE